MVTLFELGRWKAARGAVECRERLKFSTGWPMPNGQATLTGRDRSPCKVRVLPPEVDRAFPSRTRPNKSFRANLSHAITGL